MNEKDLEQEIQYLLQEADDVPENNFPYADEGSSALSESEN